MMTNENALATPDYRDKIIALMEKNETLLRSLWRLKEENENLKDVIREFKAIVERNFGEELS